MIFPAHIRREGTLICVQTAQEHCRKAAEYAGESLREVGLEHAGVLAGLVHDCGKFKAEFARYIEDGVGARGSVNHTFAGVRLLMERYHGAAAASVEDLSAELLALAVGGHHGLFDCIDEGKNSGFLHRMQRADVGYDESKQNFLEQCASLEELDVLFCRAHAQLLPIYERLAALTEDGEEYAFHLGLLARLLLSAVIEGDRRDTAEFMNDSAAASAPEDMRAFWRVYLERVEEKLNRLPQDSPLQRARREISDRCRAFAEREGGVYRLNVPTGAGKTLSSLRYALAHGARWGSRRLIFVSPLLSILEQNAAVLREYLGDDGIVLEHHSNVVQSEEGDALDWRELAVESWSAPVIITTQVQLLNTIFAGRSAAIRRFQALCGSVIVLDEVQTVPLKMLSLFNLAVDFLSEICGATVLLCSATQPCLEAVAHPLRRCRGDMIPYDAALWEPFRRCVIADAGARTLEEICAFAREQMEEARSLLLVCNRKDEAEFLFRRLKDCADESFHLSAAMCAAHRRRALEDMLSALEGSGSCLCVATQVIEAGVDVSFERVIRLSAGLDNVIQAAGRCNRNGERAEMAPVYVVPCLEERLEKLREIRTARQATDSLLDAYRRRPQDFDSNLASDKAVRWYYRKLYASVPPDHFNFCTSKGASLLDFLAHNCKFYDESAAYAGKFFMDQAFRTAGALFSVFDSETLDLAVPYGEGADLIAELTGNSHPDPRFLADWLRRVKPYTISVYAWQLQRLGNAVTECCGVSLLNPDFYDPDTGLCLEAGNNAFLEV